MVFKDERLASWVEGSLRELFADGREVESACIVAQLKSGAVMTGYYEADSARKAIFAHNINGDAMLDVVLANIDAVSEALAEYENGDEETPDE